MAYGQELVKCANACTTLTRIWIQSGMLIIRLAIGHVYIYIYILNVHACVNIAKHKGYILTYCFQTPQTNLFKQAESINSMLTVYNDWETAKLA